MTPAISWEARQAALGAEWRALVDSSSPAGDGGPERWTARLDTMVEETARLRSAGAPASTAPRDPANCVGTGPSRASRSGPSCPWPRTLRT